MKKLPLHDLHESWGVQFFEQAGWLIPLHYGGAEKELQAALGHAALLDRSYLGKLLLRGADAVEFVDRISSNDMNELLATTVCDTIFNTPDGHIMDYCRVLKLDDGLLLISSYLDSNHLNDWLNRFVATQDVIIEDVSETFNWFTLMGPHSRSLLQGISEEPITDEDDIIWLNCAGESFPAIKNDHFILPAYNLCFSAKESEKILTGLVDRMYVAGGRFMGDQAFQIIRVESGMPDWGAELTKKYNAHEARLLKAVSFTKGNYTGQEVIAWLDTYDNVQKYLMIVDMDARPDKEPPMNIFFYDEPIGTLTSYAYDPLKKRHVGLGYVKKAFTVEGLNLNVEIDSGKRRIPGALRVPPQINDLP